MSYPLVILGGGLAGLAAGIRFARFGQKTLIIEKHHRPGGLNSYYYRQGRLFETGLHAMTNYAAPGQKKAPLNRLLRQLKFSRKSFLTHQQISSEIDFPNKQLRFSNNLELLKNEVECQFPGAGQNFADLVDMVKGYDPFVPKPWISTRQTLQRYFSTNPALIDMLLCPLSFYGSPDENDMDLAQFVILFTAVFLEGFFRPAGTIKDFIDLLLAQYASFGGELRLRTEVKSLKTKVDRVTAVVVNDGETIACENIISTLGLPLQRAIAPGSVDLPGPEADKSNLSYVEGIFGVRRACLEASLPLPTIRFFSQSEKLHYCCPLDAVDFSSGVVCVPALFDGLVLPEVCEVRITHLANYRLWKAANGGAGGAAERTADYADLKARTQRQSIEILSNSIRNFAQNVVYHDTFTPLTIEKFSGKAGGAIYGSPYKVKDGTTRYKNLFLAGTDQGYLGIVGSMLSGVTMVNQHILLDS